MPSSPVRSPLDHVNVNTRYSLRSRGVEASKIKRDVLTRQTAAAVQPDKPGAYRTNHKLVLPSPPPPYQAESLPQNQAFDFVPPLTHPQKTRRLWQRVMDNTQKRKLRSDTRAERSATRTANARSGGRDNTPVSSLTTETSSPQNSTPSTSIGPSESASAPLKREADLDPIQPSQPPKKSKKNPVPSVPTGPTDGQSSITQRTDTTGSSTQKRVAQAIKDRNKMQEYWKIVIDGKDAKHNDPFEHFKTKDPLCSETSVQEHSESELCCKRRDHNHTRVCLHYTRQPGLAYTTAWVFLSPEECEAINMGYRACTPPMLANEALYALLSSKILLYEPLRPLDHMEGGRGWRSIMTCQLAPPKDDSSSGIGWHVPREPGAPAGSTPKPFTNYEPDRCFYLDHAGYAEEYHDRISQAVQVIGKRMTCPYLTVEFKKDEFSDIEAQNQVAAFGTRALYNRWLLRDKCRKYLNEPWTPDLRDSIRHYGLTLSSDVFVFWILTPKVDEETQDWNGCLMERLTDGHLGNVVGVQGIRNFAAYINEIHQWGLTEHAQGCEYDIKNVLRSKRIRTSDVDKRGPQDDRDHQVDGGQQVDEDQDDDEDQEDNE